MICARGGSTRCPSLLPLLPLLLFAVAPACTYVESSATVWVTSSPAGAQIFVDGTDSGTTTPARIAFDEFFGGDHEISIRKSGYAAEVRRVEHKTVGYTSKWQDGATDFLWMTVPLWWTLGDFFTPFAVRSGYFPKEVHVQLFPAGEAPGETATGPAATGAAPRPGS